MAKDNPRAIAATVIESLIAGKGSLTSALNRFATHPDYALLQEICYGTCRQFQLLQALLAALLEKPLRAKDRDVQGLLLVGLYQLRELRKAEYAVVNETVNASRDLGKAWARGLVNGVLRNYQRHQEQFDSNLSDSARICHPEWLVQHIRAQWPAQAESIFASGNCKPPMTLRCNQAALSRDALLDSFQGAGISATPGQLASSAIYLEQAIPVADIPGFETGMVSVQDEASQLVPGLLQLAPGLRVLDACAAPGGKTGHILESEQSLTELVALEIEARRAARIEENLQRLGLQATVCVADASNTDSWWDGQYFDRILLDAPCSATGVIRRHPDIKVLRQASDIERLKQIQFGLLESLWTTLAPGGLLLYTTCSILRQENEAIVARFLESRPDAKYQGITADWGVECAYGKQLLPGALKGPDGFYFALLRKEKAHPTGSL